MSYKKFLEENKDCTKEQLLEFLDNEEKNKNKKTKKEDPEDPPKSKKEEKPIEIPKPPPKSPEEPPITEKIEQTTKPSIIKKFLDFI